MSDHPSSFVPSEIDGIAHPPCRPPLEIIEQGEEWLVRESLQHPEEATTFDTETGRLDAMRTARDKMHADRHPCLLRWDDTAVVGGLYWNELFEQLCVQYSELLDAWVIVPATDHCVFQVADTLETACETARAVQQHYDFKHLTVYDIDGTERDTFQHQFIRHDIAATGVQFDRDRLHDAEPSTVEHDEDAEAQSDINDESTASPASTLLAAIPDLTELEEIDTSGPIFQYQATWEGGQLAHIKLLDPELAANTAAVQQFTEIIHNWQSLCSHDHLPTVYEIGPSPAAWIAYNAGDETVAECDMPYSHEVRLKVLTDVAAALEVARRHGMESATITPENVLLTSKADTVQALLAGWGLKQAVTAALGGTVVTPYTAPEQLTHTWSETTPVYQLGAFAYRLLCHTAPFSEADNLEQAIREGRLRQPSAIADVPSAVDTVVSRAMARAPDQRYTNASIFVDQLTEIFD